jgi:hypothetical protein
MRLKLEGCTRLASVTIGNASVDGRPTALWIDPPIYSD